MELVGEEVKGHELKYIICFLGDLQQTMFSILMRVTRIFDKR
jgi:hypothetical protein